MFETYYQFCRFGAKPLVRRSLSIRELLMSNSEMTVRKPVMLTFMVSICVLVALTAFFLGALAQREWLPESLGAESSISPAVDSNGNLDRLAQIEQLIADQYYGRPKTGQDDEEFWSSLEGEALAGLALGLDDYSTYLPPEEQKDAADQLAGTFDGIGVWIASRDVKMTIVAPIPGSPAEEAGILAGDVILEIDGTSVEGLSDAEALDLLKGPAGERVSLVLQRGDAEPYTLEVERRKIPIPVVTYSLDEEANIGIIKIVVFGDKTAAELDAAIKAAKNDGVEGIVLDLRNNGGGWVQSAQETIGRFVPADSGEALWEDFDPSVEGDEIDQPIIDGEVNAYDIPLVVLVNNGTASAAEIVAGALHDYERATIVGEKTFGKGSVQRVHVFDDGSSFRLTFAHWLTPDQNAIDQVGIAPDIEAPRTPPNEKGDTQLEVAIQVLSAGYATPVT
jgi:carboxyl-terminal processing protease